MDKRLIGLNMLSNFKNNDWKIGKPDFYINSISSKVAALPEHVFNHFYISENSSKQISVVDFALMTYDMGNTDKSRLMELYDIDADTIDKILAVADDISDFLDSISEEKDAQTTKSADFSEDNKTANGVSKAFKVANTNEIEM